MADALATEYAGVALSSLEALTAADVAGATRALDAVHRAGVIHGDVALRNFVRDARGRVMILDFGFGEFREDVGEERWPAKVEKELAALRNECGVVVELNTESHGSLKGNELLPTECSSARQRRHELTSHSSSRSRSAQLGSVTSTLVSNGLDSSTPEDSPKHANERALRMPV